MTRRVRAGSTQKHKKMPGDATKWGEFDNQKTCKISPIKQNNIKKEVPSKQNSNCVSFASNSSKSNLFENNGQFSEEKMTCALLKTKELDKTIKLEISNSYDTDSNKISSNLNPGDEIKVSAKESFSSNKSSFQQKVRKFKKKTKLKQSSTGDDSNSLLIDDRSPEAASDEVCKSKKEIYLKKLIKKREKMGILLLPSKVERKLYNIRRVLKKKGLPPQLQKEIIRKERRKEELKFRKTFNPSKLCFHCRETGHMFADCPKKSVSLNQETGICFKCGSPEHTSFKCPKKVQGFPFAKCFICKEQGHISKDCPSNKRGIYPKGGRCNLCGNVNHLKKDCPSLMKKRDNEADVTLKCGAVN